MDMHQPVDVSCVIRRITNQKVWYLHSFDMEWNQANWTTNFHRAHVFPNQEAANEFMRTFLGSIRSKECDTFSEYETWTI